MAIFDAYIKKIAEYIEEMRRDGRLVREFDGAGDPGQLVEGLPVRTGPGANPGIILRGDTFAELGSPAAGSCAFPLWTDNASLIKDGRITLIGPDLHQSPGASLPFGQVLMVGGRELGDKEHETLEQSQFISDQIEGYMIRSTPGRMWSRVSNDAAAKGFDLEVLGKALVAILKSEIPKIQAMEVLFVTSGKDDLQQLDGIAEQVRTIGRNIVRETWLAKGYDILECTLGVDCNSCSDKAVCDEIRDVLKVRTKKAKQAEKAIEP